MPRIESFADSKADSHFQAALKVARILSRHNYEAYLIGGAVRDIYLGSIPKDFDLVTNARPQEILKLSGLTKAKYKDTAQAFGVTRVSVEVEIRGRKATSEVELATFRQDIEAHLGRRFTKIKFATLEDDIKRRDLTINALALDLANDFLIDLAGGIEDLENKTIRFIGNPLIRIKEDPLRILRAIRLKNQLGFEYEPSAQKAITETVIGGYIEKIAVERLRDEFTRMLIHPSRARALEDMDLFGIIDITLPELASTKGVMQPAEYHLEGDVWTHTILALGFLPPTPSTRLAWALLLHDIGKTLTFSSAAKTGDRIRFDKHYEVGANLAKKILSRLRFSKAQIADISWMINYHMGVDDLPKMRETRAMEFMSHPAFSDLMALHKADAAASVRKTNGHIQTEVPNFPKLEAMWAQYQAQKHSAPPSLKDDLSIDGAWLMRQFNLKPGKNMGQILHKLNEAYLDGKITSEDGARKLVKGWLNKRQV